jgi:hypothetical protein
MHVWPSLLHHQHGPSIFNSRTFPFSTSWRSCRCCWRPTIMHVPLHLYIYSACPVIYVVSAIISKPLRYFTNCCHYVFSRGELLPLEHNNFNIQSRIRFLFPNDIVLSNKLRRCGRNSEDRAVLSSPHSLQ